MKKMSFRFFFPREKHKEVTARDAPRCQNGASRFELIEPKLPHLARSASK